MSFFEKKNTNLKEYDFRVIFRKKNNQRKLPFGWEFYSERIYHGQLAASMALKSVRSSNPTNLEFRLQRWPIPRPGKPRAGVIENVFQKTEERKKRKRLHGASAELVEVRASIS